MGSEIKSCIFCKHYFCLINQGVWGCIKNHEEMVASKCKDYDGTPPVYTMTSTKITGQSKNGAYFETKFYDYSEKEKKENE